MAITVDKASIGTATGDPSSTTIALTTNQAVAAGGLAVLSLGWANVVDLSSVSGGGLAWTIRQGRAAGGPGSANSALVYAIAPAGMPSGTTITATFTAGAVARTMGGMSLLGVDTSTPVDITDTPVGQNVATTAWTTNSMSIQAGSAIVATCWNETSNPTSTPTAPSLEALDWGYVGGVSQTTAYRIEAAAGSYTVAGTWGSAVKSVTNAVAFKAAAGGGAVARPPARRQLTARVRAAAGAAYR